MDWGDLISRVGVPAAVLAALFYGIFTAVKKAGKWAAPRADRVIETHLKFVNGLDERDKAQTEHLSTIATESQRTREMVTAHMKACELVSAANRAKAAS